MTTILNANLIKKQGLSDDDIDELEQLHDQRERIFNKMYDLDPTDAADKDTLILYGEIIESLEYNMQRLWKFEQLSSMHSWWYQVPHCKCPVLDNADMRGSDSRIYTLNCPVHGHLFPQKIGETYEIPED